MNQKVLLAHSARFGCPEQTYKEHVSKVVEKALEFAFRVAPYTPFSELFLSTVHAAAEYHDLGKVDEANQKVLWEKKNESLPVDHWDAGTAHLLEKKSIPSALCVFSHHMGIPSIYEEKSKMYPFRVRTSAKNDEKLVREITDEKLARYIKEHEAEIGSAPNLPEGRVPGTTFLRFVLSCLVDADHTDTARHYNNIILKSDISLHPERRRALLDNYVTALLKDSEGKNLTQRERERNKLREHVYNSCRNASPSDKGFVTCDSPVGTGKTTAVMAHLLNVAMTKGLRRVFVILPFTNIIDQSVEVYRKALVSEGELAEKVVAAHHHKAEFENLETRAFSFLWNAPITVTTAVQFFETLASNYPATLRKLHQIVGSAIFIDEVHAALPAHLWPLAWKWLNELVRDWGCYIVMASGSLTRFWELEEFSLPPVRLEELIKKDVREKAFEAEAIRINYKMKDVALNLSELCNWIRELPGPRLVILNTVQSAASVAKYLAGNDYCYKDKVEHISTALAPIHRKPTIERIKKRLLDKNDTNWTLVATSCVEAGVDFSFRTAAREFCSLVSTIQTAGRVNRSGKFQESNLWNFKIVPSDFLKEHLGFRVSAKILDEMYKEGKVSPDHCKEAMKREVRQKNQGNCDDDPIIKAERKKDFPDVEKQFKVIDKNAVTVVIDSDLRQRIENGDKVSPSELQQKSVNVYSSRIDQLALKPLNGFPGLYAWTLAYDDFIGYMAGVLNMMNLSDNCCI